MTVADKRLRLDQALVVRGLAATRARARDLILRQAVRVGGEVAVKPAQLVSADMQLEVQSGTNDHVARSAAKLIAALEAFGFSPQGKVAVDVGASTGGFSQVLLERGATRVFAVDVGHGQLHPTVAADPRVVALEGTDARALDGGLIAEPVGAIVADLSFISLTKALPAVLALAGPGCWLAALVKPQFELEPAAIGRGGIVRQASDGPRALALVERWVAVQGGWQVVGTCASPLPGKGGNQEFLLGAIHRE